jgi:serine phosphatase RsbU (regulator of sigma subunit)
MEASDLIGRLRELRERLAPSGGAVEPLSGGGSRKRVMVVDDDKDNLQAASQRLAKDYEVVTCKAGDEAVRQFMASSARISAVVMDIRMPGMSGLTAAKLIRNDDPYVPIIFRTGFSDEYPEDEILQLYDGSVDYVTKGQKGHDFYLRRAIARGIKSYETLMSIHETNERLREYQARFQTVVEQLIAHERNLQTAVDFQTSLLGALAQLPGLSLAAAHRFCDQMGGDFYDVLGAAEHRRGLLIADVSGHGIPAALVTGMLKAQIEAASQLVDPSALLRELNTNLFEMLSRGQQFITVAYAVVNVETGEMAYANAGHNPAALIRADGSMQSCESTGPPLGAIADLETENAALNLGKGDSLWLYTDGLFECPNKNGERYGRVRFTELIRNLRRDDLQEWTRSVLSACEGFVGNRPIADDMTILSAKAT